MPGEPATNGVAEAMVKRTIRGIRVNLLQAGHPRAYYMRAAQHHWVARNILTDSDGTSAWERRHGHAFPGEFVPYGSRITFVPSKISKDPSRKLESNMVEGIFFGWHLQPGHKWNGEYVVSALTNFVGKDLRARAMASDCNVRLKGSYHL